MKVSFWLQFSTFFSSFGFFFSFFFETKDFKKVLVWCLSFEQPPLYMDLQTFRHRQLAQQRALGEYLLMQEALVENWVLETLSMTCWVSWVVIWKVGMFAFSFCPIRKVNICRGHSFSFGGVLFCFLKKKIRLLFFCVRIKLSDWPVSLLQEYL